MQENLDAWKQGVSRATAYVQSNAAMQVQIFGFYISALGISVAIARDDVQPLVFYGFIPISAFLLMVVSASYFSFYAYQNMFLYLYGKRYEPEPGFVCHEEFFDHIEPPTIRRALKLMTTYWRALPYYALWWSYIIVPPKLALTFSAFSRPYDFLIVALFSLIYVFVCVALFLRITLRGWGAIDYYLRGKHKPNMDDQLQP